MRILPTNSPFEIVVNIAYAYVRFRVDGFILFPLEGQNDAFVMVKNTHRASIDILKFNIKSLQELGDVKRKGTAIVKTIADNTIQELVEINYKLESMGETDPLRKYVQEESEPIVITISDVEEVKEEEKKIIVNVMLEENDET